jgi:glutathione S-transferase
MDAQTPAITLNVFAPFLGTPDSSPFVMKTMMLLKLAGRPYQVAPGNLGKAPKGRLPFIVDGGTVVADSTFIRFYLEKRYGIDFDAGLSPEQRAVAWAVEKMCEEHLIFALLHLRWADRANFRKGLSRLFNAIVPWPLRPFVRAVMRRRTVRRVVVQGMGEHSKEEIATLAIKDIDALATLLGDKPFLMGAKPCGADATVFGFVTALMTPELKSPIVAAALSHKNLVAYRDRILRSFFAETVPA